MKKPTVILSLLLTLALAVPAQTQEVFDLLRKGDAAAVKALIERSPQLASERDGDGDTPLHYAASLGNADLVSFLIDKGAKLDLQDADRKTPLHLASMNDRRDAVAALLKRGAAIEARDDYRRTALILCARERGRAATGRVLIEAGADVNAEDKFGSTALELATWRGKADFVDLLLEKGARVPASGDKWTDALSEAAANGLTSLFRRLTEGGQDLTALGPSDERLLHSAAAGGSAEIVGLLIEKGFPQAKADRFGWTPLHYAARDGRTEVARVLIERGAPADARTLMGQTAYNVAVERKMDAVAELLAEKGVDLSETRFPVLEGEYFGQKPPGDRPELFAPGIVSSIWGLHSTAVFSPDGSEVYWAPMMTFPGEIYSRGGLLTMKRVEGRWTPPAWAPFSGPNGLDDVPFFSADGKRLYFISRRPLPGETERGSEKIWYTDRTPSGWGEPRPLDPNVNSVDKHWQFSLDREGKPLFRGTSPDSRGMSDIYMARPSAAPTRSPSTWAIPSTRPRSTTLRSSPRTELPPVLAPIRPLGELPGRRRRLDRARELGPEVNSPSIELCPWSRPTASTCSPQPARRREPRLLGPGQGHRGPEGQPRGGRRKGRHREGHRDNIGWALTKDGRSSRARWPATRACSSSIPVGAHGRLEPARGELRLLDGPALQSDERARSGTCASACHGRATPPGGGACSTTWPMGRQADRLERHALDRVLEKRDGKWLIVQMHFSFTADKVAAETKAKPEARKAGPERK